DGEAIAPMPVTERKERLRALLSGSGSPLHFSDHEIGRGRAFYDHACTLKVEGIVSKRVDAPYAPGNRRPGLKVKCLNREEFVVVGWTDPEGARRPGSGRCCLPITTRMAGWSTRAAPARASTMPNLKNLWRRLQPLATSNMPLDMPPPRDSRFGSPLTLTACIGCGPNSSPKSNT